MYRKDIVPHVLVIPSWYPSSTDEVRGSFFREQALALSRHGCRIGVIYPQLPLLRQWRVTFTMSRGLTEENDKGVLTLRWHGLLPINSHGYIKLGLRLYREYVARHGKPDLIHAHSTLYGGLLAYRIKERFNVPFIITEHSSAFARGRVQHLQRAAASRAVASASKRIAVSGNLRELLQHFFGDRAGEWVTLPNIVNKRFTNPALTTSARDKPPFAFLCISALITDKAVDTLVTAFAEAFKGTSTVLRIGGDGPERERLETFVEKLDVSEQIKFLGPLTRQQVVAELARADAFVISSRYETFGVVVIEALAMGKPVVATRCGGPESIIRPQDGMLVPTDDIPALAKALCYVYQNIDDYDPKAIRQACIDRFGEEVVTDKLKQIYRSVLEREDRA